MNAIPHPQVMDELLQQNTYREKGYTRGQIAAFRNAGKAVAPRTECV